MSVSPSSPLTLDELANLVVQAREKSVRAWCEKRAPALREALHLEMNDLLKRLQEDPSVTPSFEIGFRTPATIPVPIKEYPNLRTLEVPEECTGYMLRALVNQEKPALFAIDIDIGSIQGCVAWVVRYTLQEEGTPGEGEGGV